MNKTSTVKNLNLTPNLTLIPRSMLSLKKKEDSIPYNSAAGEKLTDDVAQKKIVIKRLVK